LAHVVQLEDPSAAEKFPAGQSTHDVPDWALAKGEYLPCTHDWHVASELCPVLAEYFPAVQSVHCVRLMYPVPTPYIPFPHAVHAEAWLTSWYDPLAHAVHSVAPSTAENDPAEHATQALNAIALAVAEYLPLSQDVQVASKLCPVRSNHFPATQSVHSVWLV